MTLTHWFFKEDFIGCFLGAGMTLDVQEIILKNIERVSALRGWHSWEETKKYSNIINIKLSCVVEKKQRILYHIFGK